jgi:atrial natriuretic peptide receptor A
LIDGTEIIVRVAARETPPFRPVVGNRDCPEELTELMERSWSDNPDERPTFEMIRSIIRCIRK